MAVDTVARPIPFKPTLARTFGSLRHRNFRLLWTGTIATQAGFWMFSLAQGWLVLEITRSNPAFWLGVVGFAGGLPLLIFSLMGGVFADRFERRKLLLIYQTLSAVFITAFAIIVTLRLVEIWHVMTVAFLFGTMMALNIPLRQSLVPSLIEKEDLLNASALNSLGFNAMRVVGPALAGILITTVGTLGVFWLMAVTYGWSLLWVIQMDAVPHANLRRDISPFRNLIDGLRFISHDKNILSLMALATVPGILVLPYLQLVPLFARNILQVGATGLGMLEGAVGIGAVVSALAVASLGNLRHKGRIMIAVTILYATLVALFGLSPFFLLSLLILALSGIAWSVLNALNSTLIQLSTPDEYRGRVFSVYSLTWGLQPLGSLFLASLAEGLGAPIAVAISGVIAALMSMALAWLNPRVRQMD